MTLLEMMEQPTMTQPAAVPASAITQPERDLSASTFCLLLKFSVLGNSKKVETSQITTDAREDSVKVSKVLLDSPELEAINKADREFKKEIDALALPYDAGMRLIPNEIMENVYQMCEEYAHQTRPPLIRGFMEMYRDRAAQAPSRLASLYDPADYPEPEKVEAKFAFEYRIVMFGAIPEQLRQISGKIFDREKEKLAAHMEQAGQAIDEALFETCAQLVSHLRQKLEPEADGRERRLHETTVKNLQEFVANFDVRNVRNNSQLAGQVDALKGLMRGVSKDRLKNSEGLRRRLHAELAQVEQNLVAERKPTRRFKLAEE